MSCSSPKSPFKRRLKEMNPSDANLCPILKVGDGTTSDPLKLVPSLHHMASVKIASHMWATKNARDESVKLFELLNRVTQSDFTRLSLKVEAGVGRLPLPDKVVGHLKYVTSRLALDIYNWISLEGTCLSFKAWHYIHFIQWTSRGRIDRRKTAQLIASDHCIQERCLEKLAEYYCFNLSGKALLDQVVKFRDPFEVAKDNIGLCDDYDSFDDDDYDLYNEFVDKFFPRTHYDIIEMPILEKESSLCQKESGQVKEMRESVFLIVMNFCDGYLLMKYWSSFNQELKATILRHLNYSECGPRNADMLCFFLSQMSPEFRSNLLRRQSINILMILFKDWLWQDTFIEIFLEALPTMSIFKVCRLLELMARWIRNDLHHSQRGRILAQMLHIITPLLKSSVEWICNSNFITALIFLFTEENIDIIEFIYSLIPSDQIESHLDTLVGYTIKEPLGYDLKLLKFAVNLFFSNDDDIEDHFMKNDYYYNKIEFIVNHRNIQMLDSFIKIFLFDKVKIDFLKLKIHQSYPTLFGDWLNGRRSCRTCKYRNEVRYRRLGRQLGFP